MSGPIQSRINPPVARTTTDFSDAKVKDLNEKAMDSTAGGETSFRDLIMNSNDDIGLQRIAQKNGDGLKAAKTDEEFARMMHDKVNKENLRKPQNNLDKDAFLKLFITQMQNQDPLNPDNSAEMAAQLAQFNGLEQMMNVNKNLEKMQNEAAVSRAVGLVDFVGKEIKLDNGKLRLEGGKVSDGIMTVDQETPKAMLEVRDSAGAVVATRDLGMLKKGDHAVEWNGLNNKGEKSANGVYTFNVVAKDMNDQDLPVKITSLVKVTGVDLKDTGGSFYTDLGKIRIGEIASIGTSGTFDKILKAEKAPEPKVKAVAEAGTEEAEGAATEARDEQGKPIAPAATAAPAANEAQGKEGVEQAAVKPAASVAPAPAPAKSPSPAGREPVAGDANTVDLSRLPPPMMEIPFAGG